jgi:hypothetical protein
VLTLVLALAGLSGCVTTPKSTAPAQVFVTAAGTVNYLGASCSPDQLAARLDRDDVEPAQEIRVHMEDIHNAQLRNRIAAGLIQKGYKRILFIAAPRASAEIVGEPDTHIEESPAGKDEAQKRGE